MAQRCVQSERCVQSVRCGASCVVVTPEELWSLCRPKDDEQGGGGKIIAGMPTGPGPNGSHGVNGGSETDGLISGRKTSRYCADLFMMLPKVAQQC